MANLTVPAFFLLSDYPGHDTGSAGEYDGGLRAYFPDVLGDIAPEAVKILDKVELVYESLREIPIRVTTFRRYPLSGEGASYEQVDAKTEETVEPGVFYATTSPTWDTDPYATLRTFVATASFATSQGKSMGIGIYVQNDLTPWKLIKMILTYSVEDAVWKGMGVVR